MIGIHANQWPK